MVGHACCSVPPACVHFRVAAFVRVLGWVCVVRACVYRSPPDELDKIQQASPKLVRGIRWITNFDGPISAGESPIASRATWPRVARNYALDGAFHHGLALLPDRDLSFDLQSNPSQMPAWADVLGKMQNLTVVIDHLGHPRHLMGGATTTSGSKFDHARYHEWKSSMALMAQLPNVHVKLSMLDYCMPGWWASMEREDRLRDMVLETIDTFGAARCMFASNWPVDGEGGALPGRLFERYSHWVRDLSLEARESLFKDTARAVYRL